ncbi:MAG: PIN domain-containing protein [Candidatus Kapabacteria bacterium]|nr:PIN domain-containing protein [Candidatus Kapabacteria bacterium]
MNEIVMIDSSCWIKFLRNSDENIADLVQSLIQKDLAAICGITELEVIQGVKSYKQAEMIKDLFSSLIYYEFSREDFINAGNRIRKLRENGITLAISDVLIAELTIRNNLKLLTTDNDFRFIEELVFY